MDLITAILLAIIEGLTEFLPISSTGHLIIASSVLGESNSAFTKTYIVAIQLGAILSVVVLYFKRFIKSINFYKKLFIGLLPAILAGILLDDLINRLLGSVLVVAISLFLGGVVLLFIDKLFAENEKQSDRMPNMQQSFLIGIFQVIAMIPGVSRSAATIFGGLTQKLNRKSAAEFSFFLAVPTMFAATSYKLYKFYTDDGFFSHQQIEHLLIGNLVAFITAMLAIKAFISILTRYGFKIFGWYRIILGAILLVYIALGVDFKIV